MKFLSGNGKVHFNPAKSTTNIGKTYPLAVFSLCFTNISNAFFINIAIYVNLTREQHFKGSGLFIHASSTLFDVRMKEVRVTVRHDIQAESCVTAHALDRVEVREVIVDENSEP